MKQVTIVMTLHDDVVQNDVKTWVKSCPFEISPAGGQTVTWQNIRDDQPAKGATDGKAKRKLFSKT